MKSVWPVFILLSVFAQEIAKTEYEVRSSNSKKGDRLPPLIYLEHICKFSLR